MNRTEIFEADLSAGDQAVAVVDLLNVYARDPMGGGEPLSGFAMENLIPRLKERQDSLVILACVNHVPAGLVICFEGFSTFQCKPLMNIHDIVVDKAFRGKRPAAGLLEKVAEIARERGCCKLTLEVLERNHAAQKAYRSFGFAPYELTPETGRAMFWETKIGENIEAF